MRSRQRILWFVSVILAAGLMLVIWVNAQQLGKGEAELVIPATPAGYLKDQLPYSLEQVESVTIRSLNNEKVIIVPEDREYTLLQNLNWLDLSAARAEDHMQSEASIMVRMQLPEGAYEIPYDIESNTYQLGDDRFYADKQVYGYMNRLLRPETELALIDRISAQAYGELVQNTAAVDESFGYDTDRFEMDGKDIHGWREQLEETADYSVLARYYSPELNQMEEIRYFRESGIGLSDDLVFLKDTVETRDGIKVGLSKEEVLARLGQANLELDSQWSYKSGDYLKFHLYFADNRIAFIRLTMPL